MENSAQYSILTFVPLFIVVDALGILPVVISMGQDMSRREHHKMIHVATITATVVGLVFLFFWAVDSAGDGHFGRFICYCRRTYPAGAFHHIHDNRADDAGNKRRNGRRSPHWHTSNGGTGYNSNTLVALATQFPIYMVLVSFALNMLIAWAIFMVGRRIAHFLGQGGLKAVSRVFSLLLAAIAVSMIIRGLEMLNILST